MHPKDRYKDNIASILHNQSNNGRVIAGSLLISQHVKIETVAGSVPHTEYEIQIQITV